jgi:hypothetical protein
MVPIKIFQITLSKNMLSSIFKIVTFYHVKYMYTCAAGFALLNLPKGKSLGRSKPETNSSNEQAH